MRKTMQKRMTESEEWIPDELKFGAIPKIDVYRKSDMRLVMCGVSAEKAAAYTEVSVGFVWSAVKARYKVATESGFVFYYNPDSIVYQTRCTEIGLNEQEKPPRYAFNRRFFMMRLRECGWLFITDFLKYAGIPITTYKKRQKIGWRGYPVNNEMLVRMSKALTCDIDDLVYNADR